MHVCRILDYFVFISLWMHLLCLLDRILKSSCLHCNPASFLSCSLCSDIILKCECATIRYLRHAPMCRRTLFCFVLIWIILYSCKMLYCLCIIKNVSAAWARSTTRHAFGTYKLQYKLISQNTVWILHNIGLWIWQEIDNLIKDWRAQKKWQLAALNII